MSEIKLTISKSAIENNTADIMVLPLRSKDKIEMRVSWKIYIPDVSGVVYVDVMTGNIIAQESTFIS